MLDMYLLIAHPRFASPRDTTWKRLFFFGRILQDIVTVRLSKPNTGFLFPIDIESQRHATSLFLSALVQLTKTAECSFDVFNKMQFVRRTLLPFS